MLEAEDDEPELTDDSALLLEGFGFEEALLSAFDSDWGLDSAFGLEELLFGFEEELFGFSLEAGAGACELAGACGSEEELLSSLLPLSPPVALSPLS